jgi:hypothetical protein
VWHASHQLGEADARAFFELPSIQEMCQKAVEPTWLLAHVLEQQDLAPRVDLPGSAKQRREQGDRAADEFALRDAFDDRASRGAIWIDDTRGSARGQSSKHALTRKRGRSRKLREHRPP